MKTFLDRWRTALSRCFVHQQGGSNRHVQRLYRRVHRNRDLSVCRLDDGSGQPGPFAAKNERNRDAKITLP
jgi:hypothetical protein